MIKSKLKVATSILDDLHSIEDCIKENRFEGFIKDDGLFPEWEKDCMLPKLNVGDYININKTFFKVTEVCYEFENECMIYLIKP